MGPVRARPQHGQRGFSLPELLVVLAILGLLVLVVVGLATPKLHQLSVLTAARQFVSALTAARMIASARGAEVPVVVRIDPDNRYEYVDAAGRTRVEQVPTGVRIASSDTPIVFGPMGSVASTSETVFEIEAGGKTVRWAVATNLAGVAKVSRLPDE